MPDRRGLLQHAWIPAGHRGAGGGGALPFCHAGAGAGHSARRAADVPPGGTGKSARRRLDQHAGAAAELLAQQAAGAGAAGIRGHRLRHHHHALGSRRGSPHDREPAAAVAAVGQAADRDHAAHSGAGCGVPQGLQGGHRHRGGDRAGLPVPECGGGLQGPDAGAGAAAAVFRVVRGAGARLCQPAGPDRRGAAGVSAAGAGAVRLRDRRGGDAAHQGRPGRRSCPARRAHPQRQEAADDRRADHERLPDRQQHGHHPADLARRLPAGRRGQRASAGLPGTPPAGRDFRKCLRPEYHRYLVVRRGQRHGRAAEHRAALPAALRDGPRLGTDESPAGAGVHQRGAAGHAGLPRQRGPAGRSVRHRRAGADDLGGGGGHGSRRCATANAG